MSKSGDSYERVREVVSYQDDVFVWVYLDQVDRVVRYETYVIGYDHKGEPSTLDFVLEEGVLDNMHEVPLFWELLQEYEPARFGKASDVARTNDGRLAAPASLKYFYCALSDEQIKRIHAYFAEQEERLKHERRPRWTRMLRALGYDVIPSL